MTGLQNLKEQAKKKSVSIRSTCLAVPRECHLTNSLNHMQGNTASGAEMAAKKDQTRELMLEKQRKAEERKAAEAAAGGKR